MEGLTGQVGTRGLINHGIRDGRGLIHWRGLKRSTSVGGGPQAFPRRVGPWSIPVTQAGAPIAAQTAPRQEWFSLRALRRGRGVWLVSMGPQRGRGVGGGGRGTSHPQIGCWPPGLAQHS